MEVPASGSPDVRRAALVFVVLFGVYVANGREIGSVDSQVTKFAAREFLLRGSLALNHVVGATPELARRHTFVLAPDGRYRSAYSPVPALAAAAVVWPLSVTGALDLRQTQAPAVIATVAAALLTALAVALAFLTARRYLAPGRALLVAAGLGLGTGLWSTASQTLWQHETAIFGLSMAVLALTAPRPGYVAAAAAGVGLALACTSRLPLAPIAAVFVLGIWKRGGIGPMLAAGAVLAAAAAALLAFNLRAYGHLLGALPALEALHVDFHGTDRSFRLAWQGYAGLLFSPNRGLIVYSPIVAVAALGARRAWRLGWESPMRWCLVAAAAQFALYGAYTVWWAGHTFGPRYMLDVLPLLVPAAALGLVNMPVRSATAALAILALAWSIGVAALGAFVYPAEAWNSDPADVDRAHERLWDWRDTQIERAAETPPNSRNFMLFR